MAAAEMHVAELQAAGAINTPIGSIILSEPMIRQMLADWLTERTRYLLVRFRRNGQFIDEIWQDRQRNAYTIGLA